MNLIDKKYIRSVLFSDRFTIIHSVIQNITMFAWLSILIYTRSYYVIYLLIGLLGFLCKKNLNHDKKAIFKRNERLNIILAAVFSFTIILANHDLSSSMIERIAASLKRPSQIENLMNNMALFNVIFILFYVPMLFIGGTYIVYFILSFISQKLTSFVWNRYNYNSDSRSVFLKSFAVITVFFSLIMLLCYYPGISSGDNREQLEQILSGQYSNHHPFYHTMMIRVFVTIGQSLFNSLNIGVALYNLFSIMLLSAAFSYVIVTFHQLNICKNVIICTALFFMLLPINMTYSFTMWKDIPFSAATLFFTVSVFRYLENLGKSQNLNLSISVLSGFGMCLLRSNGMFAFALTFIIFVLWFGKKNQKLCVSLICVIFVSLLLKHPVLSALGVTQPAPVESLSIPLQQISRTVVDNDDLSDEQKKLISKVIEIDKIKEIYDPDISDPIKFYIRDHGGQDYFTQHKSEYIGLYFKLGISHPKSYILAWVDQTKGYWNGGYDYWKFTFTSATDDVGTMRIVYSNALQKAVYSYIKLFEYLDILKPFLSIGLYTWLLLLTVFIGYRKKDKITVFSALPCIAIIVSLLIATPVFAELRYAYATFCCLPFLAVIAFRNNSKETKNEETINHE